MSPRARGLSSRPRPRCAADARALVARAREVEAIDRRNRHLDGELDRVVGPRISSRTTMCRGRAGGRGSSRPRPRCTVDAPTIISLQTTMCRGRADCHLAPDHDVAAGARALVARAREVEAIDRRNRQLDGELDRVVGPRDLLRSSRPERRCAAGAPTVISLQTTMSPRARGAVISSPTAMRRGRADCHLSRRRCRRGRAGSHLAPDDDVLRTRGLSSSSPTAICSRRYLVDAQQPVSTPPFTE